MATPRFNIVDSKAKDCLEPKADVDASSSCS